MRQDPRPLESAPPEFPRTPSYTDPPAGYASLSVLLRALLGAFEQRWNGSIVIRDACGRLSSILRCHEGYVVAGRVQDGAKLFQAVVALCSTREPMSISFAPDQDAVGCGAGVTVARVDACALAAAVVRNGSADDSAAEAMSFIGAGSIIMRSKVEFARYVFSPLERALVDIIDSGPLTLLELELHATLPRETFARVVFTLWITRALTLAPAWVRTVSGPISQPASAGERRSRRDDEPTVVVALDSTRDAPGTSPLVFDASAQARAQRHFQLAEFLLERGYAREAVFEAQKALRLCKPRPAQEALYAWALYQRSGAGPRIAQHVWDHLENALRLDPNCESARHYRALLLERMQSF